MCSSGIIWNLFGESGWRLLSRIAGILYVRMPLISFSLIKRGQSRGQVNPPRTSKFHNSPLVRLLEKEDFFPPQKKNCHHIVVSFFPFNYPKEPFVTRDNYKSNF